MAIGVHEFLRMVELFQQGMGDSAEFRNLADQCSKEDVPYFERMDRIIQVALERQVGDLAQMIQGKVGQLKRSIP